MAATAIRRGCVVTPAAGIDAWMEAEAEGVREENSHGCPVPVSLKWTNPIEG